MQKTLLLWLVAVNSLLAQQSIQPLLNRSIQGEQPKQLSSIQKPGEPSKAYSVRISQYLKSTTKAKESARIAAMGRLNPKASGSSDTLYVGFSGKDTVITGTFNHTGPICVLANKLTFRQASASNTGNIIVIGGQLVIDTSAFNNTGFIYVLGNGQLTVNGTHLSNFGDLYVFGKGQVTMNSSTFVLPQTYFYQLSVLMGNQALVTLNNTTWNCNSMSHGFTITDTAKLVENNMVLHGFTTTGIDSHGSITINKTTQAGEFVINDYSNLNIKNSDTVLLWHQFADTAVVNWTFGKSDTVVTPYQFNKSKPGVKGVEYNVQVDSSHTVWWAMMPSSGSNVTISNSKIRAIGLWFDKGNDSLSVSGIYDSTFYSAGQVAGLTDRVLVLNNTYVETWSLYVFKNQKVSLSKCQMGEIGMESTSRFYGNNYEVDGTGGYHWTTNTSVAFANGLVDYSWARSEDSSIFIIGYSAMVNAEAIATSVLIVVQSYVMNGPLAVDGGAAWYASINPPTGLLTNSSVPINGSAYIVNGPTSTLMRFKSWSLFYQPSGAPLWTAISRGNSSAVSNSLLNNWNTTGLSPGPYTLRLNLKSTYGDSVDAFLPVTLSSATGLNEARELGDVVLYPNPSTGYVNLGFNLEKTEKIRVVLGDITGKSLFSDENYVCQAGTSILGLNTSQMSPGVYICRIFTSTGSIQRLFVIKRD